MGTICLAEKHFKTAESARILSPKLLLTFTIITECSAVISGNGLPVVTESNL